MDKNNVDVINEQENENGFFNIIYNYKEENKDYNNSKNNINIDNDNNYEEKKENKESDDEIINNDDNDSYNSENYSDINNSQNEEEENNENFSNNINEEENNNNELNEINDIEVNNNIENINNINIVNLNNNSENNNNIDLKLFSNKSTIYYYNCARDYYESGQFKNGLIYIMIYIKLIPNNPKAFCLKAKIYSKLKMYQESLNNFKKSIKLGDEDNLENIYGCAKAYKELNQYNNALIFYKKALKIEKNSKSYYLLATCLSEMGKREEAIELYNQSISLDENYFLAYYNKGICLSNLNFKEEAIKMYDKTISLNNNFIDAYFQKGFCLYNLKKYEEALEIMDTILKLDPNYYQAYYEKGFCLLKMKRINEAIFEITKFLEKNNKFENAYFQRGYCYELIKNYSLAIKDYYKVIEINNHKNEVYFRLGICFLNKKIISDALKMFNRAIKLNRANYEAYYFKGICLNYLKYYEKAIITFNFFLNCFKINKRLYNEIDNIKIINTYYNKGKCLMSLKRFTEAVNMFSKYLKIDKNCLDVYYKRAISFYKIRKNNESINDLSFIIDNFNNKEIIINYNKNNINKENIIIDKIEDNNDVNDSIYYCEEEKNNENIGIYDNIKDIYLLRAFSFFNINEIDKALNDFNEFFKILNQNEINLENYENIKDLVSAYFKRGYCYFIKKEYLLSFKDYEKTLELDPSYKTAYFNMAICLTNLNRKKESIYYYEKIIDECPTDIEAQLGICQSYREIGNSKKALELLDKAFLIFKEDSPKIANLYYEKGMCLYNREKYNEAISSFEKAIEFSHSTKKLLLSDCYYHKGICFLKINKRDKGFKDFEKALKYNEKNGEIYFYKAYYFMDLEKYEEAIKYYLKAININNEIYSVKKDGNFNIAYCYLQLENFEEAKKYLNICQRINDNKIKNYFQNGVLACEDEKIGAQEYLLDFSERFKEIKNKFIDINYYLGICNIELKKYEDAINNFNICNRYDYRFADGYYYKGIAYSKLNRYKKAIEQFKKAIDCDNKPIYQQALNNEENKLNILYNKIEKAEINLHSNSKEKNKNKNDNKIKKSQKIRLNKSVNLGKNNKIRQRINTQRTLFKKLNILTPFKPLHMSSSKCKKSRQINLSTSSKELIKIHLKEKISNYEKNERIRGIIKHNINDSEKKFKKRFTKKFYTKHLKKNKDYENKNYIFVNL